LAYFGKTANEADWGNGFLNVLDGLNRIFCRKFHRLNKINIPVDSSGAAIVVANHLSGLDPLLLLASTTRPVHFLIAREQYERFGFKWLFKAVGCIPIDRSKKSDSSMRLAIRALQEGNVVALFPQGKIHLPTDAPVKLKPGAAKLALMSQCPVHPVEITGVAMPGSVMLAVIVRGHANIRLCGMIETHGETVDGINQKIRSCIG
jgi:1-acyl-sn-glycerol-3-phosphate acyltransferase